MPQCKNCKAELQGDYCHACGQRDVPVGITFAQTLSDFFSYNFSVDGPVWTTIRLLALNPGQLVRNFIEGKRKPYYRPVQFFVVSTVIYLLAMEWVGYSPLEGQLPEATGTERIRDIVRNAERAGQWMITNLGNLLFLLVASVGVVLKLADWRRYRFAEYLVFGFYVTGVYVLTALFSVFINVQSNNLNALKFILFIAYFTYAYMSLLGGFKVGRLIAGVALSITSLLLYIAAAFGLSYTIVVTML